MLTNIRKKEARAWRAFYEMRLQSRTLSHYFGRSTYNDRSQALRFGLGKMGGRVSKLPTWVKVIAYGIAALVIAGAEERGNGTAAGLLLLCFVIYRRLAAIERAILSRPD